jgi:rod shape-determining protein MreD
VSRLLVRLPPLLALAVVLHTAVLPELRIAGVAADLLLLLGITAGLSAGPARGAVVGFAAGLLADCFLQTPFGLSALTHALVGHGVGALHRRLVPTGRWVPVATATVASAVGVILFAVLGAAIGQAHLLRGGLLRVVVVVALVNGVLHVLVVGPLRWAVAPERGPRLVRR